MAAHRRGRPKTRPEYRYLTHAQRMAVRTSKQWLAGYPHLVAQWHETKNVDLYPYEVSHGAARRIWWKCGEGPDHEWSTRAVDRTKRALGCPFCAGRRVSVTNALATKYRDVAREWHPTRNGALSPEDVTAHSHRRVWWRCRRDPRHQWQASIVNRTNSRAGLHSSQRRSTGARPRAGTGCPLCSGHSVAWSTSLAALRPSIAAEWAPTLNGKLTPRDVTTGSPRRAWWRCRKDASHVWCATIANRARRKRPAGCPFCSGRRVSATNNLATKHPAIAAEWHPTRNGNLTARDVTAGTKRLVWWRCSVDRSHVWRSSILNRTRPRGCRFCARRPRGKSRGAGSTRTT